MDENDIKSVRAQALEQSLISYLLQKRELSERNGVGRRRILSIQLEIKANNENLNKLHPIFCVQIGMFVAEFNVLNGLKERGNCFGLERYIRDWAERDSVKSEMFELAGINLEGGSNLENPSGVRNTIR